MRAELRSAGPMCPALGSGAQEHAAVSFTTLHWRQRGAHSAAVKYTVLLLCVPLLEADCKRAWRTWLAQCQV